MRRILSSAIVILAASSVTLGCDNPSSSAPAAASQSPSASAAEAAPLRVGDAAPDVSMKLHDGTTVALSSLKGKQVLVYFYPKDDTPGCRFEAQGIRDQWADIQQAGVTVYGVSLQDATSHQAFIDKEKLPFPLVVDTTGAVARAFHVPVKGEYAKRQTFLIGTDGKIKKVWLEVDPKGHAQEIVDAARAS